MDSHNDMHMAAVVSKGTPAMQNESR